jgi:hypothetical protein
VAIRIRKRQGELFADGSEGKYFAVASNQWDWGPKKLLEWHRQKAGSIEAVHDVLKNELAGGVMPCARFGANAAWLRLALITHNVLTALKRIGTAGALAPRQTEALTQLPLSDFLFAGQTGPACSPPATARSSAQTATLTMARCMALDAGPGVTPTDGSSAAFF